MFQCKFDNCAMYERRLFHLVHSSLGVKHVNISCTLLTLNIFYWTFRAHVHNKQETYRQKGLATSSLNLA